MLLERHKKLQRWNGTSHEPAAPAARYLLKRLLAWNSSRSLVADRAAVARDRDPPSVRTIGQTRRTSSI
jgi:hypothetical protein